MCVCSCVFVYIRVLTICSHLWVHQFHATADGVLARTVSFTNKPKTKRWKSRNGYRFLSAARPKLFTCCARSNCVNNSIIIIGLHINMDKLVLYWAQTIQTGNVFFCVACAKYNVVWVSLLSSMQRVRARERDREKKKHKKKTKSPSRLPGYCGCVELLLLPFNFILHSNLLLLLLL